MKDTSKNKISMNQIGGNHYSSLSIQPIDYIQANNLGFIEGNIIKYVTRYKSKGGLEDLYKAKSYLDRLIEENKKESSLDISYSGTVVGNYVVDETGVKHY